jgi:hypothetical protein
VVPEAAGVEQRSGYVVREVPESEGGAAEVFQAPVDRLCWPVGRAGPVEEREDVGGALLELAAELADLHERGGDAAGDGIDDGCHQLLRRLPIGFAVGGDHALVDAPGRLDLDVLGDREQCLETGLLPVSEQLRAGVEDAAGLVERIVFAAPPAVQALLDATTAGVEGVAGEADDVERVHHRLRVRELLADGGLEAGEPVHRDDLDTIAPVLRACGEPGLEHGFRATLDHVQQTGGAGLVAVRGEVDDDGDVLVADSRVAPDVLVDADHGDAVEPGGIVDQHSTPFSEDRVVRRVPTDTESGGDAGDGEVVDHERFQRPPHPATGQLGSLGRRCREVLTPGPSASRALVAADPDQQRRRAMTERLVGETPRVRPARERLATASPAPRIRLGDAALDHRAIRLKKLTGGHEAELVEMAEHGQIRGREGSVVHVEVFRQMVSVRTSIIGRPRPSSGDRRAQPPTPSTAKSPFSGRRVRLAWERRSRSRLLVRTL